MTTIYLIRHAQAEGNLYRRCHGWYNSLITVKGYQHIERLEQRFRDIHVDAVYSSDLYRTMTTAQAVCRPKGLPLRLVPDLREVNMGRWEDRTWGDVLHEETAEMSAFLHCDPAWYVNGGDTFPGLQERFCRAVEHIAQAHPNQTVAVVSHGTAIRFGIARWLGLPIEQAGDIPLGDNTSVSRLKVEGGQVTVEYYGDSSHLGELATFPHRSDLSNDDVVRNMMATALYFRPLSLPAQSDVYLAARKDGWLASHGTMDGFDGASFLAHAQRNCDHAPDSVLAAYADGTFVGVLQMDWQQEAEAGIGRIPFFYMCPDFRSKGLGVQLLGQAIAAYREQGRHYIRLRCAPENIRAKKFYESHGFYKVGEEPGGIGHLDTMEKYIGFELK